MIHCACPKCNASYTLDDDHAGRKLRCEVCGQAFAWTAEKGSVFVVDSAPGGGNRRLGWMIGLVGVAVIVAGLAVFMIGGHPANKAGASKSVPVKRNIPVGVSAERAASYEDALARARVSGKDIVVFQRGSDWNRLGETLYQTIWRTDEFAAELGNRFILTEVDYPENMGAEPVPVLGADVPDTTRASAGAPAVRLAKACEEAVPLPLSDIVSIQSEGGAIYTQRADTAWVAGGPNSAKDVLVVTLKVVRGGQLVRLDFPMDSTLPGNGPGRAINGNFVLTEVAARVGTNALVFTAAWANASEGTMVPLQAIDGIADKGDNGWNAMAHQHQRRTLMLVLGSAVPSGSTVTLRLVCAAQWGQHVPGCILGAVLADSHAAEDVIRVAQAQAKRAKDGKFSWWDTSCCPRVALMDSAGRAVACENKPRLGLTVETLAERIKTMRVVREKRDILWARAEKTVGPMKAELLRQGLDLMGFANWFGNANSYKPIHDAIRAADPKDVSGAVRWLGFGGDPRNGVPWAAPDWSQILNKKDLTDADYEKALARIDKELKDPSNQVLDHEKIQRIMIAKFHVYKRWPKHEEQRFDVQRQIAAFDPDTFWGIGARGYLAMLGHAPSPMLTYGWGVTHVKPGVNTWDLTDTAYFFDHAGPYKFRMSRTGGKDTIKIQRVALLDGATLLAEARPGAELGPKTNSVETDLNLVDWRPDRKLVLRVETTADDGYTDSAGSFGVEPQLLPPPVVAAGESIRFDGVVALRQKLGEALAVEMAEGDSGVDRIVADPSLRTLLAQYELIRACGTNKVAEIAGRDGGVAFLMKMFKDTEWMESFLASDKADYPQSLENLYLLSRYGDGLDQPLYRRAGTALALQWGSGSRYRLVDRFDHLQRAHRGGLLHASFDRLTVREMRWAIPTYGTAKDYQFLLDDRQSPLGDYYGACWAVWYTDPNVYGDSVQGWTYITPWTHHYGTGTGNRPYPAHRVVGGVCGTLSGYGSAVAQAHGIMSTTVGQPGHCAYIIRSGQEWPVGYSVTWPTAASAPGWDETGYSTLHRLYEPVHQDQEQYLAAARFTWMAHFRMDRVEPPGLSVLSGGWTTLFDKAIAVQPTNYGTWLEYIKTLEAAKDVSPKMWLDLARLASRKLSVCNEAGWASAMRCLDKVLPGMTPAERMEVLLACNHELRQENWIKPEGFPYDGILNWQADRIGDPVLAVDYFGKLLAIHHSKKTDCNWIFGNVLSWGAKRFAGNPATATIYAKAMEGFFRAEGRGLDQNLLSTTLAVGIRKASESDDLESYRMWGRMADQMLPALKPQDVHLNDRQAAAAPKIKPFPGELLSQDGMLRTSSVCQFDRPLSYGRVLAGGFGGWFDTNNEDKPWVEVRLGGDSRVSGIVLINRYEYDPNHEECRSQAPIKVSVSSDGKTWTDVASFGRAEPVFRVDLTGRDLRTRRIRIERIPGIDKTKQSGRFHFREILVYGKKLY